MSRRPEHLQDIRRTYGAQLKAYAPCICPFQPHTAGKAGYKGGEVSHNFLNSGPRAPIPRPRHHLQAFSSADVCAPMTMVIWTAFRPGAFDSRC